MAFEATFTRKLSARDAEAYDAFVDEARGGAWAQARAWAPVAVAGRRFVTRFLLVRRRGEVIGAALVLRPRAVGPFALPLAIVERGPVVDDLENLPEVLGALRRRCPGRVQVMPYWAEGDADHAERILARGGFRPVQDWGSAHARTLRVELAGRDEAALFAGKQGESLRRKLRQADKAGATARRGTRSDLPALMRLYGDLMRGQGKGDKPHAYFDALGALVDGGKRGALFLCEHEGACVSALYASRHGRLATFVLGASSGAEKSFSKMVPAMAAAIRWAQREGCDAFDMGGIPLEGDPDEKRKSIAQFKLDFAKTPVRLTREHARWL
jgi:Acetyltransferase (GNAT) domain